jgi:hypothetical protein
LAETGKGTAGRELVEALKAKKMVLAQALLKTTTASRNEVNNRVQELEQDVENLEGKLARDITYRGQGQQWWRLYQSDRCQYHFGDLSSRRRSFGKIRECKETGPFTLAFVKDPFFLLDPTLTLASIPAKARGLPSLRL